MWLQAHKRAATAWRLEPGIPGKQPKSDTFKVTLHAREAL